MKPEPQTPESHCPIFDPFWIDLRDERLWQGDKVIRLNPKAFAVLRHLVQHPNQLVSQDDLLTVLWPDTIVHEAVLTVAVRELRQALGGQVRHPQFIETVYGRGYRFIASLHSLPAFSDLSWPTVYPFAGYSPRSPHPAFFVGRQSGLAQLSRWFTLALQGHRQLGLISGEAGIGKSALVEAFISKVAPQTDCWIGYGQCIDSYGAGEAYLPLLEALGRLGRGPEGPSVVSALKHYAPSWLEHLPGLVAVEECGARRHLSGPTTPARMLRELAEALECLTVERPLVLVLEDLHWSDHSTLQWLSYMIRRRDVARLLILGTYRPQDVSASGHPLRTLLTNIRPHGHCVDLGLGYLSADEITRCATFS